VVNAVFAIESVPARAKISQLLGADVVIDHTAEDPVAAIMRLTNGRGVDVAIEALGTQETFELTHRYKLDQIEEAYDLFAHQLDGVLKAAITS
jgi:threonine dehydrogenase-like Zn-dependent dehydrogenase